MSHENLKKSHDRLYAFFIVPVLIVIGIFLLQRVVYWMTDVEFGVTVELTRPYEVLCGAIVTSIAVYLVSKRSKRHHLRGALLTAFISIILFLTFGVVYSIIRSRSINFLFDDYFLYSMLDHTLYTGLGSSILVGSLFGASLAILHGRNNRDVTQPTSPLTFNERILVYTVIITFSMYVLTIITWILAKAFHMETLFILIAILNPAGFFSDPDFFEAIISNGLLTTFFYFYIFTGIITVGINGIRLSTGALKKIFYFPLLLIPVAIHTILVYFLLLAIAYGGD